MATKSYEIKPFLNGAPDIGQRKYGHVLMEGTDQTDTPMFSVSNNIRTYITGLNEDGPEVRSLPKEEQEKKKLEIRKFIARCENELTSNYEVSPDNVDNKVEFYRNVKTFKSVLAPQKTDVGTENTFWDTLAISLTNAGIAFLDNNLTDKLKAYIAGAGGYSMVAPSLSAAKASGRYMFYFDSEEESAAERITVSKLRNKAGGKLETLFDTNSNKLFYITKLAAKHSLHIRKGQNATPNTVMYDICEKFLNGEGKIGNRQEACTQFLKWDAAKLDDLRNICYLEDGISLSQIQLNSEGQFVFMPTGVVLGKGKDNALATLAAGTNEQVYKALVALCEKEWGSD